MKGFEIVSDARLEKLADVLVHYSMDIQPGEWVALFGDVIALPALRAVHAAVIRAGGNATLMMSDEMMTRTARREASDSQLDWLDPTLKLVYEQVDAYVFFLGSNNTRAMTHIDPARMQRVQRARRSLQETFLRRTSEDSLNWVVTQFPTEANAQEGNMSLEEYEDFVYSAMFLNHDDPAAEWRKLADMQQKKIDWLKGKKQVKLQGENIDLELSIADRVWINADGKKNLPDGEIFTGPIEDSVNGWVRFSYPSIVGGRAVSGIELKFEHGKVVQAKAEQNDDLLQAQLNTDDGARYPGEFAISTNFGIQKFTGNILFDEKIGGTVHMAIGAGYPETGSQNQSAVHWDMICDMRNDSTIQVDGELFYKNGEFVV
jgi:aminopeptidase